jgi:hypothetical protein
MGINGKYWRMVVWRDALARCALSLTFLCTALPAITDTVISTSQAQNTSRETTDGVRRRASEKELRYNPYWEGFRLKQQGNCAEAVPLLRPLAKLGHGHEDAQVALAECLIEQAGVANLTEQAARLETATVSHQDNYKEALEWLELAANVGDFKAQGVLVELYVVRLGPSQNLQEAAKWAHLYLTNPVRLTIGAPVAIAHSLENLQSQMSEDDWLIGKEQARQWTPRFAAR